MKNGIIIFATESAKRNNKPKQKKVKKASCPSCEIKIVPKANIKETVDNNIEYKEQGDS